MIVLDTDVLSIVQRGKGDAYDVLVRRLRAASDAVYVTTVSLEEQTRGWLAFVAKRRDPDDLVIAYRKLRELVRDLAGRPMLDFDDAAATELSRLRKTRVRVGEMDLRIASIAISRSAILVTRNVAHFGRVPGLDVRDWTVGS